MPREKLQKLLTDLRQELIVSEQLDEEARAQLRRTAGDIESALESGNNTDMPDAGELQSVVVGFEAEHPRLARILGSIADTLAKLGI